MSGSLSLERGLSILRILQDANMPLGVREVARRLSLSAAAVQRLLNTLVQAGYVEQVPETRRYQIGYAVLALANHKRPHDRLVSLAGAELRKLAENDAFNGFLGVLRGRAAVYLLCVQSNSPVVIRALPGESMRLHTTALGKALMLAMSEPEVASLLGSGPLEGLTPHTVTDPAKLIAQLRTARSVGYTTSFNESIAGVVSVGAPVRDAAGAVISAISVAIPRALYPKIEISGVGERVTAAADRISIQLGWQPAKRDRGDIGHVA
jgi:IclR family KDG regulon transcriptional repressor